MNTLVIGDLHSPFILDGYLDHCIEAYAVYNCKRVMCTGDMLDNHYASFHTPDPDGYGAGEEVNRAMDMLRPWHDAFPKMKICLGNHDKIVERQAFEAGVPKVWIRSVQKVFKKLKFTGWKFAEDFIEGGILYLHGMGGKAKPRMLREGISIVQGHYHAESHLEYHVTPYEIMFALQVGCGVDIKSYAMAYGKHFTKPVIGCAVILDDYLAIPLPMRM